MVNQISYNFLVKNSFVIVLLFFVQSSFGQMEKYNYQRELSGISDSWHSVVLPNDIFAKVNPNFSDLRIFGITAKNDTVEAPYVLKIATEKITDAPVDFKLINSAKKGGFYYFTFEVPTTESVNQINLDFDNTNFDWRAKLEASQNQQEWFTVVEDYRLVSIQNNYTNYKFSNIAFTNSKYRYFRLQIAADKKPKLNKAKVFLQKTVEGIYQDFPIKNLKREEDKKRKESILYFDLGQSVPVSFLKFEVESDFDYYRPFTVEYLTDSVKTEKSWIYKYRQLMSSTLTSLEENEFKFGSTILRKLKVTIRNNDNSPLDISQISAKGFEHQMVIRFGEPATYSLNYGNEYAARPNYDIARFVNKIPSAPTRLKIGEEEIIEQKEVAKTKPLFENKLWLYGIMGVIILLLGWFSLKMMNDK